MEQSVKINVKKIWSLKVVALLSVFFFPIAGAVVALVNYAIIGNVKKGIILLLKVIATSLILNVLFIFINKNAEFNSFIVAIIVVFLIYSDQRKLFKKWIEENPNTKPRSWVSAFFLALVVDLIIVFILYFTG